MILNNYWHRRSFRAHGRASPGGKLFATPVAQLLQGHDRLVSQTITMRDDNAVLNRPLCAGIIRARRLTRKHPLARLPLSESFQPQARTGPCTRCPTPNLQSSTRPVRPLSGNFPHLSLENAKIWLLLALMFLVPVACSDPCQACLLSPMI
jgi:hypothetical protein